MSSITPKAISSVKVNVGGKVLTKNQIMPAYQTMKNNHQKRFEVIPLNDFSSTALQNPNGRIRIVVPRASWTHCDNVMFRFDVTSQNNSMSVVPTPYWFSRVDIRSANGNNLLQSMYSDTLMYNLLSVLNDSQLQSYCDSIGLDKRVANLGRADAHPQNVQKSYYLPLIGSCLSSDLNWAKQQTDLIIEFFVSPNGISASWSAGGIPYVNNCALQIESRTSSKNDIHQSYPNDVHSNTYLDVVPILKTSQTLTAGSQYSLQLDSLKGICSHLVVNIRATGTSDSYAWFQSADIFGKNPNSVVNILSPSNQGLLSDSTVPVQVLKDDVIAKNFKNAVLSDKSIYLTIPFTENVVKSLAGIMDGCFEFKQEKNNLALTPAQNKTNQVFTLATSTASVLTSGYFQVKVRNELTEPIAWNATVAQIKSAIEGLQVSQSNNVVVTCANDFTANNGSVAVTVNSPSLLFNENEWSIVSNCATGSNVQTGISTTLTTAGNMGVASNTSYDIIVYAFMYKMISQQGGSVSSMYVEHY
jgi:hypothetical protein